MLYIILPILPPILASICVFTLKGATKHGQRAKAKERLRWQASITCAFTPRTTNWSGSREYRLVPAHVSYSILSWFVSPTGTTKSIELKPMRLYRVILPCCFRLYSVIFTHLWLFLQSCRFRKASAASPMLMRSTHSNCRQHRRQTAQQFQQHLLMERYPRSCFRWTTRSRSKTRSWMRPFAKPQAVRSRRK